MKRSTVIVCIALALACSAVFAAPAQALVPDGGQGWFWQMPQPAGGFGGLTALTFPDAGNLWAVGAGGLVLHSTDEGASWAAQPTGSDANLWSVSFPDDQHGWACGGSVAGSGGVILATSNGGATWADKTPSGLTESLTNASFVSATQGWIGTTDGEVLRTSDGGARWTQVKLKSLFPSSPYDEGLTGYRTVEFVNASRGWAGGAFGQLWTTMNGGRNWMPLFSGLTPDIVVSQIDFVDPIHGWVLAQSLDTGESQVMSTSDGGFSWRTVATGDSAVDDIDATSASDIWLLDGGYSNLTALSSYFYDYGFGGVGQVTVQHSSDGGTHWQSSSVGSPFSVASLAASGKVVCAVGDGILTSSDAAQTWRSGSSGQEYYFTAAQALSANDIWAVDASGALLHSSDGTHWIEQASPARWANSLYGVSFPDAQDGWVVGTDPNGMGTGVILHTSDGGTTWGVQNSNLSGELVGVDFVDDLNGWAISDDNSGSGLNAPLTVEHTTDGGLTWVPQYVYDNASLYAVDFINDTTGWASGDYQPSQNGNGLPGIFTTTNSGLTWTKEKLPVGAPDMTGLQFLDPSNGWAVGTSYDQNYNAVQGWVLHTTDGGKSWTSVSGVADCLAETVHFSDAQDGWIGGLNGVYATTDGGASWQQVAGANGVTAIAATDASHIWAFGNGFLLSPLNAGGNTAAPVTLVDHYAAWYRTPATVTLSPNDIGGSGVQSTTYSTDGGATWQSGTSVTVDAPSDHSNDGDHTILYRSTDNDGNQEQTESLDVGIDTLGPACYAPRPSVVDAGKSGTLYFLAEDATSDVAKATITIVGKHDRVLRRFVERAGNWDYGQAFPYYWLRFRCNLKPGTYRVEVRATDWAGNPQVLIGRNRLRVVRRGAPAFHNPGWPAGLPASSSGFFSRLSHNLEGRRLLRLRASLPGAWRVPLLAHLGKLRS